MIKKGLALLIYLGLPIVFRLMAIEVRDSGYEFLAWTILITPPTVTLGLGGYFLGKVLFPGNDRMPYVFMLLGVFLLVIWECANITLFAI